MASISFLGLEKFAPQNWKVVRCHEICEKTPRRDGMSRLASCRNVQWSEGATKWVIAGPKTTFSALNLYIVTASSGTAISTDFATLTCSEILSKILIWCVTWHWACDCSFRCFHEIGRYFDNKEQERAKTRSRRHDRSQRRQEHPKIDSFWGANPGFIDFQHYATLCSGNRQNESFRLRSLFGAWSPCALAF